MTQFDTIFPQLAIDLLNELSGTTCVIYRETASYDPTIGGLSGGSSEGEQTLTCSPPLPLSKDLWEASLLEDRSLTEIWVAPLDTGWLFEPALGMKVTINAETKKHSIEGVRTFYSGANIAAYALVIKR